MNFRRYLTFEVLVRILADVVIINVAYLTALILRLLWWIATVPEALARSQLVVVGQVFATTSWLLTLISLVVYGMSGFYTRGRFYNGRFKALVIFQAVTASYLVFGLVLYLGLVRGHMRETPGAALVLACFLTLAITEGARLWAVLWQKVLKRERPALRELGGDDGIRHVLVVGGAGYVGSVLCHQLLRNGYSVRVLDALLYGKESIADLVDHPRFALLEGDSRDIGDVFRAMLDMDAVVYLGELVGDPACELDENLTLEINLAATRMVAEAARGCRVKRFIYASSCSVYGAGNDILNERSILRPVSLYARAKTGSERALLALNGTDFNPVILRLATVYGLSPRPRFDLVINVLAAQAVCEGQITIYGGEQWRPFVHVADVAKAMTRCLEAPLDSVKGQVFNVGSDEQNHTIEQIGEIVQRIVPDARLIHHQDNKDKRDYHVSFTKVRLELGFEPDYTIEDGVREVAAALRDGWIEDYQDKRYSNYKALSDPAGRPGVRARQIPELYALPQPSQELDPALVVEPPATTLGAVQ